MSHLHRAVLGALAIAVCACGSGSSAPLANPVVGDAGAPRLATDCDPLVPTYCGFPFPSNVWLVDDPKTADGQARRVRREDAAVLGSEEGRRRTPRSGRLSDGFSPGVGILTHIPGATVTGLPTPDTIAASLVARARPTILIEADTGALVPHFSRARRVDARRTTTARS